MSFVIILCGGGSSRSGPTYITFTPDLLLVDIIGCVKFKKFGRSFFFFLMSAMGIGCGVGVKRSGPIYIIFIRDVELVEILVFVMFTDNRTLL